MTETVRDSVFQTRLITVSIDLPMYHYIRTKRVGNVVMTRCLDYDAKVIIENVLDTPWVPEDFSEKARDTWLRCRYDAVEHAMDLVTDHKEEAIALLDNWRQVQVIITLNVTAIERLPIVLETLVRESTPVRVPVGKWHLPFVEDHEFKDVYDGQRLSVARCAFGCSDLDLKDALRLYRTLSPYFRSHVACPTLGTVGEVFKGWEVFK